MSTNESLIEKLLHDKTSRKAEDVYGGVSSWWKQNFGGDMPVKNLGSSEFERRAGWEHSRSFDVGLHPNSDRGRQLISYLQSNGIPYSAFTGPVTSGGKIVSTGAHIHVGPPSKRLGMESVIDQLQSNPVSTLNQPEEESLVDRLLKQKSAPPKPTYQRGAYGESAYYATHPEKNPEYVKRLSKLAHDIDWHFGYGVLMAMPTLAPDKQQQIVKLATEYATADEIKKRSGAAIMRSPAWQLLNQQRVGVVEGKDIEARTPPEVDAAQRAAFSAGANPLLKIPTSMHAAWLRPVAETVVSGAGGLLEAGAGLLRGMETPASTFNQLLGVSKANLGADFLSKHAKQAREMAAESQAVSGRGKPAQIAQGVGSGLIEYAPLAAMPQLGLESVMARIGLLGLTGGVYSGLQSGGRGEGQKDVAKHAATGAALFGLLGVPLPGKNVLTKELSNLIITGGGTTLINRATGQPWDDAATSGLVMFLLRQPEMIGQVKVRTPEGVERPATPKEIRGLLGSARFEMQTNTPVPEAGGKKPYYRSPQGATETAQQTGRRLELEPGQQDLYGAIRPGVRAGREDLPGMFPPTQTFEEFAAMRGLDFNDPRLVPMHNIEPRLRALYIAYKESVARGGGRGEGTITEVRPGTQVLDYGNFIQSFFGLLQNLGIDPQRLKTEPLLREKAVNAFNEIIDQQTNRVTTLAATYSFNPQQMLFPLPGPVGERVPTFGTETVKPTEPALTEAQLSQQYPGTLRMSEETARLNLQTLKGVKESPTWDKLSKAQKDAIETQIQRLEEQGAGALPEKPVPAKEGRNLPRWSTREQLKASEEQLRLMRREQEAAKADIPTVDTTKFNEGVEYRHAGIPFLEKLFGSRTPPDIPTAPKSVSAEVETRMKAAEGIQPPTVIEKAREAVSGIYHSFKRTYPEIDPNKNDVNAVVNDLFRQHEASPSYSKAVAFNRIAEITENLGPNRMKVFSRMLQLPDILKDIQEGKYEGKELPFGYKNAGEVQADLSNFETIAQSQPAIADALKRRQEYVGGLVQKLVDYELLSPEVMKDPRYYHRQVMEYVNNPAWTGTSSADVRMHQKGFQKSRKGGGDFNTRYQEAEFEWVSQAISLIRRKETLDAIKRVADIKPDLDNQAKVWNASHTDKKSWHDFIPDGYTSWQPKEGGHFYPTLSMTERTMNKILSGSKPFEKTDVKTVLAMGKKAEQWVVPEEIAKTMDDFRPIRDEGPIERAWTKIQSTWKQWTLLSPARVLKYNLNNTFGDLDIALAYSPKIAGGIKRSATELWNYQVRGKSTPEIEQALNLGVVDSGLSLTEIPDINKAGAFRGLTSHKLGLLSEGVEAYWSGVRNFTAWRENILRLSAFRYFKQELAKGRPVYGASEKAQIDPILRDLGPDAAAAKLARELVGDYGAVSTAGRWIRRNLIPFYSWIEINAPRYYRLLKNVPHEGSPRGAGAVAGKVAAGGIGLVVKANILMLATQLWNYAMFPDEEEELQKSGREPHIILGRNDDGTIRTLRVAGALADALDWFNLSDYPSDIADLVSGRKTPKAVVAEGVEAPPTKVVQALEPVAKTTFELASGRSTYPTIFEEGDHFFDFKTRPIRDRWEYASRVVGLDELYRRVTGRPTPPTSAGGMMDLIITQRTDPGEAAYYLVREKATRWAKERGRTIGGGEPTERSNALYYFRQATKWNDEAAAKRWLDEYVRLGGTQKGMVQSLKMGHPLGMLNKDDDKLFLQALSEEDRAVLRLATEWYEKLYGKSPKARAVELDVPRKRR